MELNLIDAGCGIGKTTAMINKMNKEKNVLFLMGTPYLNEVGRIAKECKCRSFRMPTEKETKMENIIDLLKYRNNVITTHSLLYKISELPPSSYSLLKDYTLVIDETLTFIEPLNITRDDMNTIIKEYTTIDDKERLHWKDEVSSYEGRFEDYKNKIKSGSVYANKDESGRVVSLIWIFPDDFLNSFKEVYLLTYNFKGLGLAYCMLKKIKIKNLYIDNFSITDEYKKYDYSKLKNCIHILYDDKLNSIGEKYGALSYTWYHTTKGYIPILKNNLSNFFKHKTDSISDTRIWTTFNEYESKLTGKGYKKNFIPHNMRATNDYIQTTAVAYLVNKFVNPIIKDFLRKNGIVIDEEEFALGELLQFIYRSAAREGKDIVLYIPSRRMRNILEKWINEK